MAVQGDLGPKEEVKTQFSTYEGMYRLLPQSEYSRPSRGAYNNSGANGNSPSVKVSFVTLSDSMDCGDRTQICFNYGRELFVYAYRGIKRAGDLTKPLDKRTYNKEDVPTCHDFNFSTASGSGVSLLVGLLGGQVQLIDPITKEINKAYNAGERLIDKTKVTCIRWIPGSTKQFLVAHASGCLYVYDEELSCGLDRPHYQPLKQGDGYSVVTCKTKTTRNPLYRWTVGEGCVNEFEFSPCGKYLAVVSQDGALRVFNFDTHEMLGGARSYYGGLLCVCWSPDGRYVVTGGEDDLVTVWSFPERRVVARGQGHKSWVTEVAFDPYFTLYGHDPLDMYNEDRPNCGDLRSKSNSSAAANGSARNSTTSDGLGTGLGVSNYRLGSVGQDTFLCLWDLKDDALRQPYHRPRSGTVLSANCSSTTIVPSGGKTNHTPKDSVGGSSECSHHSSLTSKFANLNFVGGGGEKRDRDKSEREHNNRRSGGASRSTALPTSNSNKVSSSSKVIATSPVAPEDLKSPLYGSCVLPRLEDCPLMEPMVCKRIGHERLTALAFREDCIVTACQDGCVFTWCRPGKQPNVTNHHSSPSPTTAVAMGGGPVPAGGTVV